MNSRSTRGRERLWVQTRVMQTVPLSFEWLCERWVRSYSCYDVARAICEVRAEVLAEDVREAFRKGFDGWRAEILCTGQGRGVGGGVRGKQARECRSSQKDR